MMIDRHRIIVGREAYAATCRATCARTRAAALYLVLEEYYDAPDALWDTLFQLTHPTRPHTPQETEWIDT